MIDTIVLMLTKDQFCITDPDKFEPSARWASQNTLGETRGIVSKQAPTKRELLAGIYKPRLMLYQYNYLSNKRETTLKIELSLPKLLFGNNFDELRNKDFLPVAQKLAETLGTMGIEVSIKNLTQAPVFAIHYSKNIALTDGSTPYHYINKIQEANVKLSLDVNQTNYRNDGLSYKWHCDTYEVVFYDKIKDLQQAKQASKRALEKDNALQLNIFDMLEKRKKLEILRMEVRLNKRKKLSQLFKKIGVKAELTFKSMFKAAISKKVLLHYLDELESKRPPLLDYRATSDKAMLAALIVDNPGLGVRQVLQLYGFRKAIEAINPRELRAMFPKYNQRGWYRLLADVGKIQMPGLQSTFSVVREYLTKFRMLKLIDLEARKNPISKSTSF